MYSHMSVFFYATPQFTELFVINRLVYQLRGVLKGKKGILLDLPPPPPINWLISGIVTD